MDRIRSILRAGIGVYQVEHYTSIDVSTRIDGKNMIVDRITETCTTSFPYRVCTCRLYAIHWEEMRRN